nr:unnamed protein product [Digitaria exilis]
MSTSPGPVGPIAGPTCGTRISGTHDCSSRSKPSTWSDGRDNTGDVAWRGCTVWRNQAVSLPRRRALGRRSILRLPRPTPRSLMQILRHSILRLLRRRNIATSGGPMHRLVSTSRPLSFMASAPPRWWGVQFMAASDPPRVWTLQLRRPYKSSGRPKEIQLFNGTISEPRTGLKRYVVAVEHREKMYLKFKKHGHVDRLVETDFASISVKTERKKLAVKSGGISHH